MKQSRYHRFIFSEEGDSITLDCGITDSSLTIEWYKAARTQGKTDLEFSVNSLLAADK